MALPAARLLAATRTLTALPPADIHLWTDGSVDGDGGTGFVIYVRGMLRVSDASPAGQRVSDIRTEAIACLAGLQAVLTLKDYSDCQGIKVLTDSKSLMQSLSQDPACQTDPTFCSIWTVLSAISSSNAVNVQWMSNVLVAHVGLEGNSAADQEAKRGSMLSQSTVPMDLSSATEALKRHQCSIAEEKYSVIHMPGSRQSTLLPALATGLVQRPGRHGGTSTQ